jgi:aminoglycoside phosphotransferase (APT) family kinase protein
MSAQTGARQLSLQAGVAEALEQVLDGVAVIAVTSQLSVYSSSFRIEDLNVGLSDGRVLQLVLKDLSWHTMLDGARLIRSHHAHDPAREVSVYRRLLPDAPPGPPRFYGAVIDVETDSHWLLLERLPGLQLRHIGELDAWTATAAWVGRLHAMFGSAAGIGAAVAARLPTWGADRMRWTMSRAAARAAHLGTTQERAQLAAVESRYETIIDRLVASGASLVHGQLFPANVIVDRVGGMRVGVLDWETAAVGPPALDLAALTEGDWPDAARRAMLSQYLMARDGCVAPAAMEVLGVEVACARVHLALELSTLPQSQIPADMAADWLGRAAELAEAIE